MNLLFEFIQQVCMSEQAGTKTLVTQVYKILSLLKFHTEYQAWNGESPIIKLLNYSPVRQLLPLIGIR